MANTNDVQAWRAHALIDGFVRAGVCDAVICPGSRSTPFTLAAVAHPAVRCTSVWDERSAGHFAVGQARVARVPTLVICTSGSAVANLFPAVVEAAMSYVPLLVLSADRPPSLHDVGANQTMPQGGIFGEFARASLTFGEPDLHAVAEADAIAANAREFAAIAVAASMSSVAGPVHINAVAVKPLEPSASFVPPVFADVQVEEHQHLAPTSEVTHGAIEDVLRAMLAAERPLIVCGPSAIECEADVAIVEELAFLLGAAMFAESASCARHTHTRWSGRSLGSFGAPRTLRRDLVPDAVLQLGDYPTAFGWPYWGSVEPFQVAAPAWTGTIGVRRADPERAAALEIFAPVRAVVQRLVDTIHVNQGSADSDTSRTGPWLARCAAVDAAWVQASTSIIEAPKNRWSEPATVRAVVGALRAGDALFVGNSLPIRLVDVWSDALPTFVPVYAQRGVSGIDGVFSEAAGVAHRRQAPTVLLVGDVSFAHDMNGLQFVHSLKHPLITVVVNNGGGQIFSQLPVGGIASEAMPYFTTTPRISIQHVAAGHLAAYARVDSVESLATAIEVARRERRSVVIEAVVEPDSAAQMTSALRARLMPVLE